MVIALASDGIIGWSGESVSIWWEKDDGKDWRVGTETETGSGSGSGMMRGESNWKFVSRVKKAISVDFSWIKNEKSTVSCQVLVLNSQISMKHFTILEQRSTRGIHRNLSYCPLAPLWLWNLKTSQPNEPESNQASVFQLLVDLCLDHNQEFDRKQFHHHQVVRLRDLSGLSSPPSQSIQIKTVDNFYRSNSILIRFLFPPLRPSKGEFIYLLILLIVSLPESGLFFGIQQIVLNK